MRRKEATIPINTDRTYCNSIGCSDGYTPIANAHDVKCDGDKCEEK